MQSTQVCVPAIVFRCLIWTMTTGLIVAGFASPLTLSTDMMLTLASFTALYTAVWCLMLPRLIPLVTRFPVLLLADIAISAVPAWLSGGWRSPFAPFVFGALMLPGALFWWRGVVGALAGYLLVDQIVGWTTWNSSVTTGAPVAALVIGYLRPLAAALIWPVSVKGWQLLTRRRARHITPPDLLEHILPSGYVKPSRLASAPVTPSLPAPQGPQSTSWRFAHQPAQTLERMEVALIPAIQQIVADAEERGLTVGVQLPATDVSLPPSHVHILTKAVEVGFDNIHSHAATRQAEITLAVEDEADIPQVVVSIRDHGNGLLDGTVDLPGFHQIRRLRYRLAEIDGSLDVHEGDDGGVVFVVRVPSA